MSFGASKQTKQAESGLGANAQQASANSTAQMQAGNQFLGQGMGILNQGNQALNQSRGFFNTLANGNQANTSALLSPDINRINAANRQQIQSLSTLMPRGGGRFGSLFQAQYAPQQQIQSLFNGARMSAAQTLPQLALSQAQLGLGTAGVGGNLFGGANQALGVGNQGYSSLGQISQNQQQMKNSLLGGLGGLAGGILTAPLGGIGGTVLGKLGSDIGGWF